MKNLKKFLAITLTVFLVSTSAWAFVEKVEQMKTSGASGTVPTSNGSGGLTMQSPAAGGTHPSFSAYQTAAQTITTSVHTVVDFGTEEWDTNNNFDLTTDKFTPTIAGKYMLACTVHGDPTAGKAISAEIFKNSASIGQVNSNQVSAGGALGSEITKIVDMNGSTDFVECRILHTKGVDMNTSPGQTQVFFQGHKLPTT